MNDVNATVDGTKNDLAKLKRTTTTVKISMFKLNRFWKRLWKMTIFNSDDVLKSFQRSCFKPKFTPCVHHAIYYCLNVSTKFREIQKSQSKIGALKQGNQITEVNFFGTKKPLGSG